MKTKQLISAQDFYHFFSEIPDHLWGTGQLKECTGKHCALYFLGARDRNIHEWLTNLYPNYDGIYDYVDNNAYLNTLRLGKLFYPDYTPETSMSTFECNIFGINDTGVSNSPKQNILNALTELI